MNRITATKYSIRAFVCGVAGFVWLIGMALAFWAAASCAPPASAPDPLLSGVAGCVCLIGLLPAMYALFCWALILYRYGSEWNPASAYLSCGAFLATLSLLLAILASLAIIVSLA